MKRYIRNAVSSPSYRPGDIVYKGHALAYQATSEIQGNIDNFPESLAEYVRYIVYIGDDTYKVEWLTDEDHLFEENYRRFFDKVNRVLENAGFIILD